MTFPSRLGRSVIAVAICVALLASAGVAGAMAGSFFGSRKPGEASLSCPGGMARLSHVFDENASVFPGDPAPVVNVIFTVEDDGFLVEEVITGTHTGTHLDAPGHFILGGTTVDDLPAEKLVWPSYVIDVRDRVAVDPDFQLSWQEIRDYEKSHGKIPKGAMVIIRTGFAEKFGTPAYTEDIAPGFSGDAVQEMVDRRKIGGVGSDYFGPDATNDALFDATYVTLLNELPVLTNLNNLDALEVSGDLLIAPAVRLADGSGYQVDVLGCLGS